MQFSEAQQWLKTLGIKCRITEETWQKMDEQTRSVFMSDVTKAVTRDEIEVEEMREVVACRINPGPKCKPLQDLISKSGVPEDDIVGRTIICTASRAHYRSVSHWVISVEGTPPRGTIVFDTNRYCPGVAFLFIQNSCKRLTGKAYETVREFVATFLYGEEGQ